ncbi:hypothetical protein CONLIGDRAFT_685801 [Coniochaeta ligniaria NRRL 30616]|uniref:Uncharacterized protein n=1 Tax=Coniochaeta ligniaria NRRL 30616 TaxID=1408157 RepID=A0A1J7I948_9PEZI|nr:hypothetical protein CONLIGDRAFT_685801 [Coniochaeta ligniaria NRRL 30616]
MKKGMASSCTLSSPVCSRIIHSASLQSSHQSSQTTFELVVELLGLSIGHGDDALTSGGAQDIRDNPEWRDVIAKTFTLVKYQHLKPLSTSSMAFLWLRLRLLRNGSPACLSSRCSNVW